MRKIPIEYPLYDSAYGSEFPEEQYYVILFDALPSKHGTKEYYSETIISYFKSIGFTEECRIVRKVAETSRESLFVNKEKMMFISVSSSTKYNVDWVSFKVIYNLSMGEIGSQIDLSLIETFKKESKKSSILLVKSDMGHLDTEEYDLIMPEIDLEMNYGKEFLKVYETMVKRLNTSKDKGIVLLHGLPGSGKTTFLRYLTGQIKDKNILFIPPSMAEALSEPSIIPFLMDNRDSILLIEDAERVIADREGKGSAAGVSNILNLTDGILGDCLNIQVIATFNMKRERIDSALLRKGRLLCEWDFKALCIENTNILLKKIFPDSNYISTKPMLLSDIYGYEDFDFSVKKDDTIGFK